MTDIERLEKKIDLILSHLGLDGEATPTATAQTAKAIGQTLALQYLDSRGKKSACLGDGSEKAFTTSTSCSTGKRTSDSGNGSKRPRTPKPQSSSKQSAKSSAR